MGQFDVAAMKAVCVVDVVTAEDTGGYCGWCSDLMERGEDIALLSDGTRVHDICSEDVLAEMGTDRPFVGAPDAVAAWGQLAARAEGGLL